MAKHQREEMDKIWRDLIAGGEPIGNGRVAGARARPSQALERNYHSTASISPADCSSALSRVLGKFEGAIPREGMTKLKLDVKRQC